MPTNPSSATPLDGEATVKDLTLAIRGIISLANTPTARVLVDVDNREELERIAESLSRVCAFLTDELGGLRQDAERWRAGDDEAGVHAAKVMAMYGSHRSFCEITICGERGVCTCGFNAAIQTVRFLRAARSLPTEPTEDSTNAE